MPAHCGFAISLVHNYIHTCIHLWLLSATGRRRQRGLKSCSKLSRVTDVDVTIIVNFVETQKPLVPLLSTDHARVSTGFVFS